MTFSERGWVSVPSCPDRRVGSAWREPRRSSPTATALREQLGRGGMGVVWRARDERLERDVALKVLHPWVADDPELRERFEREASALARLEHPNVVRLYDVLENEGQTVLVLELVEGVPLDTLIAGRTLDWDETRRVLRARSRRRSRTRTARGVVHRDLTPANVLVERGTGRVVVTDFGLARLARSARSAPISGVLAGTPEYWAPEQAAGAATGPATDLYALGCILFRLLAGRMPFEGEDRLATGLRRAHEAAPSLAAAAPGAPADAVHARRPPARPRAGAQRRRERGRASARRRPGHPRHGTPRRRRSRRSRRRRPPTLVDPDPRASRRRSCAGIRGPAHRAVTASAVSPPRSSASSSRSASRGRRLRRRERRPVRGRARPTSSGERVAAARADVAKRARDDELPVPKVKVVDRSYSESAPAGAIIAQDPPEGEADPGERRAARLGQQGQRVRRRSVRRRASRAQPPSRSSSGTGFTPSRRYAPSTEIEAWHAVETDPARRARS